MIPCDWQARGALIKQVAVRTNLRSVFEEAPIVAFSDAGSRPLLVGDHGLIFGTLFPRHGPARRIERLDEDELAALVAQPASALMSKFWGGYVAALKSGHSAEFFRDPSGALACYHCETAHAQVVASDIDLLIDAGFVIPRIDWSALGRHLYRAGLPTSETVLENIYELLAGHALRHKGGQWRQDAFWSPWDHVDTVPLLSAEESAERLTRTVHHCVRAWAEDRHILLSLSGGLDSSIVGACLADIGADVSCITMFGDDARGDERAFARILCRHLGLPLIERRYRLEDIDVAKPLSAHLPRPIGRTQALAYEHVHVELARSAARNAFFTGNGGDNVFAYSQSAAAVTDRLLVEGWGLGALTTLFDVCRQTECGPLEAAWEAIRTLNRRRYRWRPNAAALHRDLVATLADLSLEHAWLAAPARNLPGKAAHIAGLLRAQHTLEPGRSRVAPIFHPLLSQPIIERCLAIPTWQWRERGRDRAMARNAFAGALPGAISERRTKGGPDGFSIAITTAYREPIRQRLLGGHMAAHELLDLDALAALLDRDGPIDGGEHVRILELVAAEAWLDHWAMRGTVS